jgi:hypothetical protein
MKKTIENLKSNSELENIFVSGFDCRLYCHNYPKLILIGQHFGLKICGKVIDTKNVFFRKNILWREYYGEE